MQKLIIPGLIGYGIYSFAWPNKAAKIHYSPAHIRLRSENVLSMQTEEYDIMIIGGGSVGAGVALEASTRGLKSCLIEKGDFSGQTSSKSTKLLHGGVRYLDKAVHGEDVIANINLVLEGLRERSTVLNGASYMTS